MLSGKWQPFCLSLNVLTLSVLWNYSSPQNYISVSLRAQLFYFYFFFLFFAHAQLFLCNPYHTGYNILQEIFIGPTSEIFIFQYWLYMI